MNSIDVIKTELACVQRDCCRVENQCAKCDLVLPVEEIISAYRKCINLLLEHEEIKKENAELKEENEKSNVLLADIIEAFTSCSYNDDFEMAQAGREIYELFNGGKDPKEVFHNAEVPKSSRQLLKEAKEIIKKLYPHVFQGMGFMEINDYNVEKAEAEQFLKECE